MDNERLYKILGVDKNATKSQIKNAYLKMVKEYHPDKNPGNDDKIQEINYAKDILFDDEKRSLYDRYGEQALKPENQQPNHHQVQKCKPIHVEVKLKPSELYNCVTKKYKIKRDVICQQCEGKGIPREHEMNSDSYETCNKCSGRGVSMKTINMGFTQVQVPEVCNKCNGSKRTIKSIFSCQKCFAKKTVSEDFEVKFEIQKGMSYDMQVVMQCEGNSYPDFEQGDIIFRIDRSSQDEDFEINKYDIIFNKKLNISECLLGFSFVINHLNGKSIRIKSKKGEITKDGDIRVIKNLGMPRDNSRYGNLIIKFKLIYPKNISNEQKLNILKAFPIYDSKSDHSGNIQEYVCEKYEKKNKEHHTSVHTEQCVHQ